MRIFYLVYGSDISIYQQCYLSVLSLLRYEPQANISLITDNPTKLTRLAKRCDIIPISPEQLNDWKGKKKYSFRCKCKALELMVARYPDDDILFIDVDTMITSSLQAAEDAFAAGQCLLHKAEQKISDVKRKLEISYVKHLTGKTFAGVEVPKDAVMWNSGVIGLPQQLNHLAPLVTQVCDAMLQTPAKQKTLEQFAYSIVLYNTGRLIDFERPIIHYWGSKHIWNKQIAHFIAESLLTGRTIDQDIAALSNESFSGLPIMDRPQNTNKRLKALADKWFNKRITFKHLESNK